MRNNVSLKWNIRWRFANAKSKVAYYKQLVSFIRKEFEKGNYPENYRMPAIRKLARYLGVSIYQVETAYAILISSNEVLYTTGTRATFMFKNKALKELGNPKDRIMLAKLPFHAQDFLVSNIEKLNVITLGSTYPCGPLEILKKLKDGYLLKDSKRLKAPGQYLFPEAYRILKQRNLLSNDQQFCIVPSGKALYTVLESLIQPGAVVVSVSQEDVTAIETFFQLHLNSVFTGADEEGMLLESLEAICRTHPVRAVFLRPVLDFPGFSCLSSERIEQLMRLAERYKFWILMMDEDHEFSSFCLLRDNDLLNSGYMIYISNLSKLCRVFHEIGLVAGPVDFIAALKKASKKHFIGWDRFMERSIVSLYSSPTIKSDINKISSKCSSGSYALNSIFHNSFIKNAQLVFPKAGTFALIFFRPPIDSRMVESLRKTELYCQEENAVFRVGKPLDALRISLCIRNWNLLESFFKNVRCGIIEQVSLFDHRSIATGNWNVP